MASKAKIHLHGGPKDGQWIDYDHPLPKDVVITEVSSAGMKYHDYIRVGKFDYQYRESQ